MQVSDEIKESCSEFKHSRWDESVSHGLGSRIGSRGGNKKKKGFSFKVSFQTDEYGGLGIIIIFL